MIFVIQTTSAGEKPVRSQDLQAQRAYFHDLAARGILLAAGPFDDRTGGMWLVTASTVEEAISIARSDPLVQAGLERYQVRGWTRVFDPEGRLGTATEQSSSAEASVEASGPLVLPPPEEAFSIVDATDDPAHAELLVRCFASRQIAPEDPARTNYLMLSRARGWRKLLLLYEDAIAGQIEFAPPAATGLPIQGEDLTVIHCLWVLDAYTGLDGSRRLIAACAEANAGCASLATVAYNASLGWLPRSLFERHGFTVVDQLDTGRFCGETPIAAYLMWRPLREGAKPPTWNREQLISGVDFCPAYPWMFGRRLYWGRDYPYRVRLVKEGLRRPEVLEQFPVLATRAADPWTLVELGIPREDLSNAVARIQRALIAEPTYYAYVYGVDLDEMIIVFPYREYRVTKDPKSWADAIRYGKDKGIPPEELDFPPVPLSEDA
jgi:hypothetical protein